MKKNYSQKTLAACLVLFSLFASIAAAQPPARMLANFPWPEFPGRYGLIANSAAIDIDGPAKGLQRMELELPDGRFIELDRKAFKVRGPGKSLWRGRVMNHADSQVVLTVNKGRLFGRLQIDGDVYEIRPQRGGRYRIELLDQQMFPECDVTHTGMIPDYPSSLPGSPSPQSDPATAQDGSISIDLLSVYTPNARDNAGGTEAIETLIQAAVDNANVAFVESNMNIQYRLVHTAEVNYPPQTSTGDALELVTFDPDVTTLRNQYGADMVSLMVDTSNSCGSGWVQREPASTFEVWAYQTTDIDCAVGNLTFAHEHGHNLGMEHNPEDSDVGTTPGQASYPWSFGHFVDGAYRTVMSYPFPCVFGCNRVPRYSNPDILYAGVPSGIPGERDNAQTGNLVAPITAAFRNEVVPQGGVIDVQVEQSSDDVEESLADGSMLLDSPTLKFGYESTVNSEQLIGLRFVDLNIPRSAVITNSYLEFTVAETAGTTTDAVIHAEAADSAAPFDPAAYQLSTRATTAASVDWPIPAWDNAGERQSSPDLSALVQEVIDRSGWSPGGDLVFVLGSSGDRTAMAYDGDAAAAPLLHVEFEGGIPNVPPAADFTFGISGLTASFTDASTDEDGNVEAWAWDFGDGNGSTEQHPVHTYTAPGTYTASLTVNDGVLDSLPATATVAVGTPYPVPVAGDSWVNSAKPSSNYGSKPQIQVREEGKRTALGQFDLSPLAGLESSSIAAAVLKFRIDQLNSGGQVSAHAINAPWDEDLVKYNNRPAYTMTPADTASFTSADIGTIGSLDITAIVRAWVANPATAYGIALSTPEARIWFDSREKSGGVPMVIEVSAGEVINQPPVADAGGPYTGVIDSAISFDGSASYDPEASPLTYSWDFGDGSALGTGVSPSHSYASVDTYTVTLTVNDGELYSPPATTTVTVEDSASNQPPVADAGGPYSAVVGSAINFDGSASYDPEASPLTYSWDFGDDSAPGTGVSPSHSYASADTYTVTLTVNDGALDSPPATTTAMVTAGSVYQLPVTGDSWVNAVKPTNKYGSKPVFQVREEGKRIAFGQFDISSLAGLDSSAIVSAQLKLTLDDVAVGGQVTVHPVNGPWNEGSVTYNTRPAYTLTPTDTASFTSADIGSTGSFDITTIVRAWADNPSMAHGIALVTPGARLWFDAKEKAGGNPMVIEVSTGPAANQAPVADAGGPYTGVVDSVIPFDGSASYDPEAGPLTYSWDFGDGSAPGSGMNPTHTYISVDTYTVTLTVNDGDLDSPPATTTVTVNAGNQAPVADAGGPYTGVVDSAISFDGSASYDPEAGPLTYSWDFGDGSAPGSGMNPTHTYISVDTYTVTLTVNDGELDSPPVTTTAMVSVGSAYQLPVTGDSWVNAAKPTSNYGSKSQIQVREEGMRIAFGQFDISLLAGLDSSAIVSAQLKLTLDDVAIRGQVTVHPVNGPWNENTVTYNTRPAYTLTPTDTVSFTSADIGSTGSFDITPIVRAWADNPSMAHGIALATPFARLWFDAMEKPGGVPMVIEVTTGGGSP